MMTQTFHKSFMAGVAISVGCMAYLSVENRILGSLLFSVGLITICYNDYYLFTGKVCSKMCSNGRKMATILWGNLFATLFCGIAVRFVFPDLVQVAANVCNTKLHEGFSVFMRAFFCNIMIFFAVRRFGRDAASCVRIILCVMVFILCGMEHSIANNFYFVLSMDLFTIRGFFYVVACICGNALGGIVVYLIDRSTV